MISDSITMISDSITNASATSSTNARDSAKKKKRNNKSAKMKQNKLGLRREQWLSQVAVTTNKEERREKPDHIDRDDSVENLDRLNGGNLDNESFMVSPSSSYMGGGTDISTNFSERSSRRSSSSSSSSSEEDNADDDDECVDDWEALADADEEKEKLLRESAKEQENVAQSSSSVGGSISDASRKQMSNNRAWRPEDDHRPNMAKQLSFPELGKRFSTVSISCPICCEDLDVTDSSFFPCSCGFRLCLFCHKTIFDGDGRCPGCRKPYERDAITTETSFDGGCVTVRLTRSSSMFCRS